LAGTAVGRGKRVRRRTEPGARCCYDDVEDEDEDEEPRRGGRERWIRGRAVNRGGGGGCAGFAAWAVYTVLLIVVEIIISTI
jgi:hypothetical protein